MDPVALKITDLQVALAHTLSRDANAAITSCTSDRHRRETSRKEGSKHGKIPSQQGPMGRFVYLAIHIKWVIFMVNVQLNHVKLYHTPWMVYGQLQFETFSTKFGFKYHMFFSYVQLR